MKNHTYINENCTICGKKFKRVEDILVDVESDTYVCKKCSEKHRIIVKECGALYSEEEI